MQSLDHGDQLELMSAELEVENARNELAAQLQAASETGRQALGRMAREARPFLIATSVVGGVVVLACTVSLLRGAFGRRVPVSPFRLRAPPVRNSWTRQLVGALLRTAASAAASALVRRLVRQLPPPHAIGDDRAELPRAEAGQP
jgi:hypothetical protein